MFLIKYSGIVVECVIYNRVYGGAIVHVAAKFMSVTVGNATMALA